MSQCMSYTATSIFKHVLSVQIVTLWGQVLKKVGAARPLRALVRTVEAATPYASSTAAKKEALDDWRRIILCWLQPADSAQLAAEGVLYPFQYLLLCNNRSSTVCFVCDDSLTSQALVACQLCPLGSCPKGLRAYFFIGYSVICASVPWFFAMAWTSHCHLKLASPVSTRLPCV